MREGRDAPFGVLSRRDWWTPLLLAVVAVAGVLLPACSDVNVVTQSYATLDEARRAGAIRDGYLPEGLPPGTSDIREAHDPGTRRRWAVFSFPPDQADTMRALLETPPVDVDGSTIEIPGRVEWWPLLLRERLDGAAIRATGLETYRLRGGADVMAVNWPQGRAYLWNVTR